MRRFYDQARRRARGQSRLGADGFLVLAGFRPRAHGADGPEERVAGFLEIVHGFSREAALKEAARCIECGICTQTCPAHMDIPEYIRAIYDNRIEESVRIMYRTNPLPAICGRVCTHKCETVCAISHRGEAVAIRWLKRYALDNLPRRSACG
jgi:glutamate synthase (NADPH/NADH) small chain